MNLDLVNGGSSGSTASDDYNNDDSPIEKGFFNEYCLINESIDIQTLLDTLMISIKFRINDLTSKVLRWVKIKVNSNCNVIESFMNLISDIQTRYLTHGEESILIAYWKILDIVLLYLDFTCCKIEIVSAPTANNYNRFNNFKNSARQSGKTLRLTKSTSKTFFGETPRSTTTVGREQDTNKLMIYDTI